MIGPKMRCERPQNTGKSAPQAQFAILVFLRHYPTFGLHYIDYALPQAYNVCVMAPCEGWEGAWGTCINGEVLRLFV